MDTTDGTEITPSDEIEEILAEENEEQQEEEKKRSGWKILLLLLLIGFSVIACAAIAYFFLLPLGKSLWVTESTPLPAATEPAIQEPTEQEPTEIASACTQTGTVSFLVLGVDAPYTDEPKGADAIRLVQIDFETSDVNVVALPRDLWVSTPGLNDLEIGSERLGLTYYYAKENAPDDIDEVIFGTNMLAQTLYDNFGFVPDHYITVHISKFDDIVDAMGGVLITVPEEFKSVNYVFPTGDLRLNGEQALEYASNMLVDTEWDRFDRQDIVLQAMFDQVTSPQIIGNIPALISELSETITTDLSVLEITDLSCLANDISMDEVNYIEVDQTMITKQSNSNILLPVEKKITELLGSIFK